MSIIGKIVAWLLGIGAVAAGGLYLLGSRPQNPPDHDVWLTEQEAYEDQIAHTGMDGGAFVTQGLRIRDPREVAAREGHTPADYALTNGSFEALQSGEVIYKRHADGKERRSVWVEDDRKFYFMDESGCLARNIYAFDGYYAGPDGSWDESVPRLGTDGAPAPGKRYYKDGDREVGYILFDVRQDGRYTARVTTLGYTEEYVLDPFGWSCYAMEKVDDAITRAHLAVPDDRTVLFSQAGQTVKYIRE